MNANHLDRRREPRIVAEGSVELIAEDPMSQSVTAELMDYSANGFRAQHGDAGLTAGTLVRFRHAAAQGEAKVVWVRIVKNQVESGFLVL
ncbi:MAG: PilZ domain-containing protein [bacterium]|nr:PilZ domain-containing protein [bacterium]